MWTKTGNTFKTVARIAMTLSEISPFSRDRTLIHRVTKKPLTEEWLREYLAKAIHFPLSARTTIQEWPGAGMATSNDEGAG